jgi:hypothetical protein
MTSRGFDVSGASMAIAALLLDIHFPPKSYKVIFKTCPKCRFRLNLLHAVIKAEG